MKPTLLVLAAGMGSRYGGVKQIDAVGAHGEALLDYSVYDARRAGYGKVVFIIRKDIEKDFRERLFDRIARNMDAQYVFQGLDSLLTEDQYRTACENGRAKPWGTVHALLCARDAVKEPFTVINADDYYGVQSYKILGDYLSTLTPDSTQYAMVGYTLNKTMTPAGSVSRGVCQVKDGFLQGMRENTKIEFDPQGRVVSHLPEGDVYLTGEEPVSMNFFGFTPAAFDYFGKYFADFIPAAVSTPKGECLLPDAAGEIVRLGLGTMRVFGTPERWFGMTYREDREVVRENLIRKTAEGLYPEKLWEKD